MRTQSETDNALYIALRQYSVLDGSQMSSDIWLNVNFVYFNGPNAFPGAIS